MSKHDKREAAGGRYAHGTRCDGCNKHIGRDHMTDEEVCGASDGPGFFLCGRSSCDACMPVFQGRPAAERLAHYTATRAARGA